MKQLAYLLLIVSIITTSCKTQPNSHKPNPSGNAGVMIIVMNDAVKKTEAGKKLWDIMVQPMIGLPQEEPMFDVSVIPHRSLSDFMKTYRNIVVVEVGQEVQKEGIFFHKGTWAKQQALVRIYAKDAASMKQLVDDNELKLVGFFTKAERERLSHYFKTTFNKDLKDKVANTFGVSMNIPRDFSLRKEEADFIWMSQETNSSSLGLMIYEIDYVGEGSFSKEYLLNQRDKTMMKKVPGPSEGSYMTTEHQFPINYQVIKTPTDTNTVMLRGLWKVQGDMMGGPFIAWHIITSNEIR
ncbi:hypothetical protein JCM21142_93907 [Saccharicrinis fermentans DSM 9555 = JCM 21142]|uniref:DUF4837 domain-containing protein n=1 Tax=Saccharicrinis fermentans DSM 9555 = JCM 21142 TaxID=869213 RepID=W7YA35_9BACT|nr:DUF4837 family protein [Saccharicrinis fermentans]GAF05182.1 hypothetical protein JCM21142_93907 [Saccharicrinis fermentans DSM 9555 = JCM 21142]